MAIKIRSIRDALRVAWKLVAVFVVSTLCLNVYSEGTALILTAKGEAFSQVIEGLKGDIGDELKFDVFELEKDNSESDIKARINQVKPDVVVLIGNNSINLYAKYQKIDPDKEFPPSIALAALFIDKFINNVKNSSGIRYEIPAVTSFVNMRSVLKSPIKTVGVIYREWMKPLIEVDRKYLEAEGIALKAVELPNKDDDLNGLLKSAIQTLVNAKVDAVWVLNDNELLNGKSIGSLWIPELGKTDIPVLVGIKPLLKTEFNFGSFAIVPDHYGLGVQAASIIFELMDDEWSLGDRAIAQPISVRKIVNVSVLEKKSINVQKEKLQEVDEVIQ